MRRDEQRFWREFSEKRLRILCALLDAVATGLRNLPKVNLDRPPRLADFASWVSACEESLEMEPGEALVACKLNFSEVGNLALESCPLSAPLGSLAEIGFRGTMAELLAQLNMLVCDDTP
jgi:hypothetical protein